MGQVKFFALGGLGENGKNMFICEVDERIFILDAGLKYPSVDLYGVDAIIPDISYLVRNKERVQGLFISHGHEDHVGAIVELLKVFNIGVFATHFTMSIIEDAITEASLKLTDYRLYRINEGKVMKFGPTTVEFYNVSHSIPEAINIAICTKDGVIVYAPDFCFDTDIDARYRISFKRINDIAKYGVLALCAESLGTSNLNRVPNHLALDNTLDEAFQKRQRVIVSLFSSDLDKLQRVINRCVEHNRRFAIIGRKAQKIVNIAMNSNYLKFPEENLVNLRYMDETTKNNEEDLVVIITGLRHEPFFMLQRMCREQDRLISINEQDNIIMVTPPVPGTERMAAKTMDILLKSGATVTDIKKGQLKSSHADPETLKMLYTMLNPKYFIPIIGEYRHQYQHKNILIDAGYPENRIVMLDNGEVAEFVDGVYVGIKEKVSVGDVLVDGSVIGDINEVVLKDRELFAEDGVVIIALAIDEIKKEIISGPEIICKGFAILDSLEELIELIKDEVSEKVIGYMYKRNLDWMEAKNRLRDDILKTIIRNTQKNPMVLIKIIDVNRH